MGDMSEYYLSMADPFGEDWYGDEPINVTSCRYCGSFNVRWGRLKGKWRLFNAEGGPHVCKEYFKQR